MAYKRKNGFKCQKWLKKVKNYKNTAKNDQNETEMVLKKPAITQIFILFVSNEYIS